MSETAGSMFAKIITDQLEGRDVSEERKQEFVNQSSKQTGSRVSFAGVSSNKTMDRAEHLQWCKDRANACIDAGNTKEAFASMTSDMGKHEETDNHLALEMGMMMLLGGHLESPDQMRKFINGFN